MRRLLPLLLVCLVHGVWATAAHADAKDDFAAGVRAYGNRNYREAERLFRKAIAQSDQELRRADVEIYNSVREPYLPHFWLARALVQLNQCAEAHAELTRSENQGVLQKIPAYDNLVPRLRADCPLPVPTPGAATTTTQPPPVVTPAGSDPNRGNTETIAAPPPITGTTATTTTNPVMPAITTTAALGEDAQLRDLRTRVRQQIADARRLRGITVDKVTPEWSRAQTALQASLNAATVAESGSDVALLSRRSTELAERSRTVVFLSSSRAIPPAGPPPELRQAVAAFFNGDYRSAAETLRNASFSDPRARAQTFLIRGVARYSLFLAEGGKDQPLRKLALDDLAGFYAADPTGTIPMAGSFSPKLLRVLADIRNP